MHTSDLLSRLTKVKPAGQRHWMACCPAHNDNNPSLSITEADDGKILLKCFSGCDTAAIVGEIGLELSDLFAEPLPERVTVATPKRKPVPSGEPRVVASYQYRNMLGDVAYRVDRIEPGRNGGRKEFAQYARKGDEYVAGMKGVERVLYRLPDISKAQEVWVVEGEGKADALSRLGFQATCNVGGSNGWMDAYAEYLTGKDVVIWPDNDEPGGKWCKAVHASLQGKAATVRFVKSPDPDNDACDTINRIGDEDHAAAAILDLLEKATTLHRGFDLPIYSMAEMERRYSEMVARIDDVGLDLGKWLPALGAYTRKIVPGEVVLIMAETGVGKTACGQNILHAAHPMTTLMFSLELPETLAYERFLGIGRNMQGKDVEIMYLQGHKERDFRDAKLNHIHVCPKSSLHPDEIEKLVIQSELVIGAKPQVVLVDYVQLVRGSGAGRRERIADAAEAMKRVAKTTGAIFVVLSQVARKGDDTGGPIFLNDAKEAGEIENSAGLILGAWRHTTESDRLMVKVLKQTKGVSMRDNVIKCRIHDSLRITQQCVEQG